MFSKYQQNSNNNIHNNANTVMSVAQSNMDKNKIKVSVSGWQGASHPDVINFISRKTRVPIQDSFIEGNLVVGYVNTPAMADKLLTWNGVKFAGNSLKFNKLGSSDNSIPMSNNLVVLTNFFYTRYNAELKMLNLSALNQDQNLIASGLLNFLATPNKLYPAIMKIALNEKKKGVVVETVDLSFNNLKEVFCLNTLYEAFPDLKNLSLANNIIDKLTSLEQWKNKFNSLRELIMINNPITTDPRYKNVIAKIFPKLVLLDSITIRDEQKLKNIYEISGFPQQQFFFENNEVGQYSSGFVSNFLNLWDTNRQQLLSLYTDQSQFSLALDTSIPSSTVEESDQSPSFGFYNGLNRNSIKVSTEKLKEQRLGVGQQKIFDLWKLLPMSKHSLVETPDAYSVETITYPAVNGFLITLHGHYVETSKPQEDPNAPQKKTQYNNRTRRYNNSYSSSTADSNTLSKKSFDRTWVVIPQNGSVIIACDLLSIRSYTKGSWIKKKEIPVQPIAPGIQTGPIPLAAGMNAMQPTTPPTNVQLPPEMMAKMNPAQLQLINRIHTETKLNAQYSYMLCEQSNWQYDIAIKGFQSSMNNLPREAFVM